jgi:hypothetical protein
MWKVAMSFDPCSGLHALTYNCGSWTSHHIMCHVRAPHLFSVAITHLTKRLNLIHTTCPTMGPVVTYLSCHWYSNCYHCFQAWGSSWVYQSVIAEYYVSGHWHSQVQLGCFILATYCSSLAALAQIILYLEMLKFSKNCFSQKTTLWKWLTIKEDLF